ncbi:MAG TPA: dihydrolipoyl dehydrogenase [Gemmatimonadota bacterium]|nr:dihydrolipoyl dehydrogenase [Gemmatimonadota bacterium]
MVDEPYDVVIVGSGPGGYVAAIRAGQLGLRSALVEKDPFQGGTCLHRGCIPTKALLENAARYQELLHAGEFGLEVGEVRVDWERVQQRKRGIVRQLAAGVAGLLKKHGVEVVTGWGRLAGPRRVEVFGGSPGASGSEGPPLRTLAAEHIVIATGSIPREIPSLPCDGERILHSDHVLELSAVPESLVVVGAGAVGVEFASVYHSFGSRVVLVEALPRILPIEDDEVSVELAKSFSKSGIDVRTSTSLEGAEVHAAGVRVRLSGDDSGEVDAERLLIAIGRSPVSDGIGLDTTRAEPRCGYIVVDEYCETAEPGVFAIGDVNPTPWLAHVASMEGVMVVERIAGREIHPVPYDETPNCTYCEPEVASVGLTERAAREAGHEVRVGRFPFLASGRAKIIGHTEGFVKIVADAKYDEVLGVHIIGARATELIAEAGAVLRLEGTVEELVHTIHAHPTLSESVHEAAHAVYEHALHF